MRKLLALTAIPLTLAFVLAGCASAETTPAPSSGTTVTESPTPAAVDPEFLELLKTSLSSAEPFTVGNFEVQVLAFNVDESNSLPEDFEVKEPTDGFVYGGLQLQFTYKGTGSAVDEIQLLKVVVVDGLGTAFTTPGPDELYEALNVGTNLDTLEANGVVGSTTFVEVDPKAKDFYLAIGESTGDPIIVKLDPTLL